MSSLVDDIDVRRFEDDLPRPLWIVFSFCTYSISKPERFWHNYEAHMPSGCRDVVGERSTVQGGRIDLETIAMQDAVLFLGIVM